MLDSRDCGGAANPVWRVHSRYGESHLRTSRLPLPPHD